MHLLYRLRTHLPPCLPTTNLHIHTLTRLHTCPNCTLKPRVASLMALRGLKIFSSLAMETEIEVHPSFNSTLFEHVK